MTWIFKFKKHGELQRSYIYADSAGDAILFFKSEKFKELQSGCIPEDSVELWKYATGQPECCIMRRALV